MGTQSSKIRKATEEMGGDPRFTLASTLPKGTTVFYVVICAALIASVVIMMLLVSSYDFDAEKKAVDKTRSGSSGVTLKHDEATVAHEGHVADREHLTL